MNEDKFNQGSIDLERAWRDEEYRSSLTPEQLAKLPPNPAEDSELSQTDLDQITGGVESNTGQGDSLIHAWPSKWPVGNN